MNFFVKQSVNENTMNPEGTISGNDVHYCSEEEKEVSWIRETRIRISMQMGFKAYRDELDWLARCYLCAVNIYPEEDCPPMPLPVAPGYAKNLARRSEMAQKAMLPPTLKMVLKTYYPLPVHQSSMHPQHPEISSCSQSPLPCTEPESLGDDQTDSVSLGAQADGRKEEQLEFSLAVQPNDMTGIIGLGSRTRWSEYKFWRKRKRWLWTVICTPTKGGISFFKLRLGWTPKQHKSPLAISHW